MCQCVCGVGGWVGVEACETPTYLEEGPDGDDGAGEDVGLTRAAPDGAVLAVAWGFDVVWRVVCRWVMLSPRFDMHHRQRKRAWYLRPLGLSQQRRSPTSCLISPVVGSRTLRGTYSSGDACVDALCE